MGGKDTTVLFCYLLSYLDTGGTGGCGNIATISYIKECHKI